MSLQKPALVYKANNAYQFNNNRDFLLITNGQGIRCGLCNSKIFFAYSNWKGHTKSKKHQKLIHEIKKDIKGEDSDILKLKEDLRIQKILVCQYANKCENYKIKLKAIQKELKQMKAELKKKFKMNSS